MDPKLLSIEPTDDDMLRVCLESDGLKVCTFVSSHHLVDQKRPQLEQAILKLSHDAFQL